MKLSETIDRLVARLLKVARSRRPYRSKKGCRDDRLRYRRLRRREAIRFAEWLRGLC